ncbi:MAG: MerR family transcriptional regulator [Defluviitaleaceae bacterium]|nr:MerR family transcriptional regulator [Defluviitaleaceae bacterium]MCL2273499.1 MerR family transcriptional regulator [Defluviitaleaceae bacterium]
MSKYTTGEMARLCNVTVRTVQFYHTKGLLIPSDLTEGGRRLYTDDDLTKLRLICTLKAIGLSLDLIKGILESDAPGKVLALLLNEQLKMLSHEISERQKQLESIEVIKESIRNKVTIPVNSIIGIEDMMEKNKKVRSKFKRLTAIACLMSLPTFGAIALWIIKGMWLPFVIVFPITQLLGVLLAKHHYKDAAFICAKCNAVFKPLFKDALFTSGTPKARWLCCTKCGHTGYCVETISDLTDDD